MSGGLAIPVGVTAAELIGLATVTAFAGQNPSLGSVANNFRIGPWRPPQWSQPALYMITVPGAYAPVLGPSTTTASDNGAGTIKVDVSANLIPANQPPTYLVFDGVMRASHTQQARPTRYPVQNQTNFTDHVILEPAHLSMDISMSDAVQAYSDGVWVGNPSKSVSCFQVLDALRAARVPVTVTTRLKTYTNMILTEVVPEESVRTLHGLRARLEFQQIFVATVTSSVQGVSSRQQTTDTTTLGPTNTTPVPSGVQAQNGLPSTATGIGSSDSLQQTTGTVNGAGNWSSNNTGSLSNFLNAAPLTP